MICVRLDLLYFFAVLTFGAPVLFANDSFSLTVRDRALGKTPVIFGINPGPLEQESAYPEWIRALRVNGVRLRISAKPNPTKVSIISLNDFKRELVNLRCSSEKDKESLWVSTEKVDEETLGELCQAGITSLVTISCNFSYLLLNPEGTMNWRQAWGFWESYYGLAYHLARHHQICRFQLFNEPNHERNAGLSQMEYTARMAVGCDAIQSAIEDAGKNSYSKLEPMISAPTTSTIGAFEKTGEPGARDDKIGWGQLSMKNIHNRLDGTSADNYQQFQQYAVQHYSKNPEAFLDKLNILMGLLRKSNSGRDFPVIMSEFNVHTAKRFATRTTTMDSPEEYSALGSMCVALAESKMMEVYFFRLTLSQDIPERKSLEKGIDLKKNGIHYVNEQGSVPFITGTTRAAEVIRLATTAMRDGKELLEIKNESTVRATATRDKDSTFVLLARTNTANNPSLKITFPRSMGSSLLTWEPVTPSSFGATQILTHSIGQKDVNVDLPATSVGLLSVRTAGSTTPSVIPSAASFSTALGSLQTGGSDGAATLFQFPTFTRNVSVAVFLRLKGNSTAPLPVPVHLYRVVGILPDDSAMRSGRIPFLRKLSTQEEPELSVEGLGKDLHWVAGFTIEPNTQVTCVDITTALNRAIDKPLSLLLTRDRRHIGDTPEPDPIKWESAELVLYPR